MPYLLEVYGKIAYSKGAVEAIFPFRTGDSLEKFEDFGNAVNGIPSQVFLMRKSPPNKKQIKFLEQCSDVQTFCVSPFVNDKIFRHIDKVPHKGDKIKIEDPHRSNTFVILHVVSHFMDIKKINFHNLYGYDRVDRQTDQVLRNICGDHLQSVGTADSSLAKPYGMIYHISGSMVAFVSPLQIRCKGVEWQMHTELRTMTVSQFLYS